MEWWKTLLRVAGCRLTPYNFCLATYASRLERRCCSAAVEKTKIKEKVEGSKMRGFKLEVKGKRQKVKGKRIKDPTFQLPGFSW